MNNSPAEVLRAAFVARGAGGMPWDGPGYVVDGDGDDIVTPDGSPVIVVAEPTPPLWPVYVGSLPNAPDNAVCVYDTGGLMDGRIMGTGETIIHPGFQLRVRGMDHPTAYKKIDAIRRLLDKILNFEVVLDGATYIIHATTQRGGILSLGEEPEAKRRNSFTLNGTVTLREEPE